MGTIDSGCVSGSELTATSVDVEYYTISYVSDECDSYGDTSEFWSCADGNVTKKEYSNGDCSGNADSEVTYVANGKMVCDGADGSSGLLHTCGAADIVVDFDDSGVDQSSVICAFVFSFIGLINFSLQ